MKNYVTILLLLISLQAFSQIISPNGDNLFYYNGAADVTFRYAARGTGGRALVHAPGNILALNFGSDFTGGTTIGNDVYFKDGGNSFIRSGNFGVGTNNPAYKLDVNGTIRAREIKIDLNGADFVFENNYRLRSLPSLEQYVKKNKHLPGIESADKMKADGTDLGALNTKLLQKIEELTLYTIEQDKRLEQQGKEIAELKKKNDMIEELKHMIEQQNEKIAKLTKE